jgi:uncharacterized membrane protein YfhO
MAKNQKEKSSSSQANTIAPAISFDKILEGKSLYVFLGLALLLVCIIFGEFIFGKGLYMYKDIGSDTVTYWWPHYVQMSEYIHKLGMPKWAFNQGVGQNVYALSIGDPFSLFMCLLDKDTIPHAFIYMEIIKIVGGGLFIYLYLRTLNASLLACIIGGLLFAFGGYMILGSGWYLVSTEAFYASMVLYTGERFLRYGTWYLLPIPFCLLGILQPFYVYLYAILLTVYCITRTLLNENWDGKKLIVTLFKMGGLALFGVLLGSIVFYSNVMLLINNPRVTGGASTFKILSSLPTFMLSPSQMNSSVFARLFSNDLLGAGSNYKGYANYLESPILYIGLLSLLLAPQAFLFYNKRKRTILLVVTGICLIPLVFIYFRFMFWLFAGDFYRSYTFFISLMILFFAIKALTSIDRTSTIHLKTLVGTLVILLLMLYHNFWPENQSPVDTSLRNMIAILLVVYAGLIYLMGQKQYKTYAVAGMGLCLIIELASFASTTVSKREYMTTDELTQKKGYNDYSVEALAYVKSKSNGFYRIYKGYHPNASDYVCLNDPQIQDYNGLTDYLEWNQFNYVSFLRELHVKNYADSLYSKWLFGLSDRVLLKTLLSVKYAFIVQPNYNGPAVAYDSLTTFGNVKVFKNKYFLPLGFTYDKFITLPEFRGSAVDIMLLNAFVADDKDIPAFNGMAQLTSKTTLPPLTFDSYNAFVAALKKDTLAINTFDQNNIKGTIKVDEKKLLFFSIPYDEGWHATIDGKEATTYKVNIGFTGLLLDKGEHTVEMHYIVPYFKAGAYTTGICILLYAFAFVRYRKRPL